jgi:hypothetical protein
MPFDISWLIDKRVVLMYMYGNVDIEEVKQQTEASRTYRALGVTPVHTIVDSREITKVPMSFDKIRQMMSSNAIPGSWTIILTSNSVTRFIATLVTQTVGMQYRFMESPDEALAYLYQLDPSLVEYEVNKEVWQTSR